jgi:hypothetical protein
VFFDGEGFVKGARDLEIYEEVKDTPLDMDSLPNLYRWKMFMDK